MVNENLKIMKPIEGNILKRLVIKDPPLNPLPRGEISFEQDLCKN